MTGIVVSERDALAANTCADHPITGIPGVGSAARAVCDAGQVAAPIVVVGSIASTDELVERVVGVDCVPTELLKVCLNFNLAE